MFSLEARIHWNVLVCRERREGESERERERERGRGRGREREREREREGGRENTRWNETEIWRKRSDNLDHHVHYICSTFQTTQIIQVRSTI